MKYIKTYNSHNYKYDIGNYVLFFNPDTKTKLQGQIVDIEKGSFVWPYRINYFEERTRLLGEDEIIRRLSLEEIEDFEIKRNMNKYNI